MATKIVDERKLARAGFVRTATNIVHGESLWERDDEPNRSFLDHEAIEWLEQRERLEKSARKRKR
jgi:hypothetical protein